MSDSKHHARSLLPKVWPFVAPFKRRLFLALALSVTVVIMAVSEPLLLKALFEALGGEAFERCGRIVAGLVGLMVAREIMNALVDRLSWGVRLGVNQSITRATVERLHALPLAFHRRESVGGILTKMDRGINGFVAAFGEVVFSIVPAVLHLFLAIAIMVRLEPRLSLVALMLVPLAPVVGAAAAPAQTKRDRALMKRWTGIFARFSEVLSGIAAVKSFAIEKAEQQRFLRDVGEANATVLEGVRADGRVTAVKNLASAGARVAVLAAGSILVARGEVSIGTLIAFLGYLGGLFAPVQGLTGSYQLLHRGFVGLETIFSILDAEESILDAPGAVTAASLAGELEFRSVSFGYVEGTDVLSSVNLHVKPGEFVALVGASGGGKSTLIRLLQRLYDPREGSVLLDGKDVRAYTQASLRRHIGIVLQDNHLFNESIRDNIAFGRADVSFDEIVAAAKVAHAHEFISLLPDGYDTMAGDSGARLSTGQRQRIAIARAILKRPSILVLDEATSALDAESEALVTQAMSEISQGRTTLVIAHRLSTVARADRIVVVRGGRIVESGTHRDLVGYNGYYASLVALQLNGFISEAA